MAQTITDFKSFLEDAKEAVTELSDFTKKEEQLRMEELRLEKSLEAEQKAVQDAISMTVKKRREEMESSYDSEIGKLQEKLKKIRARREKAKNQGMKDRIKEETMELHEHNRELRVRMKTLFQSQRVPSFCQSGFYYALYFPRGFREIITFLLTFAVCFLLVPYGVYSMLPDKKTLYLVLIYVAAIFVFGGIYTVVGNATKGRHQSALQEGRSIRSLINSNNKKIRVITASIKRDRNEAIYNLEKFDDEIAQLEQEMAQTIRKKKEALNTFENVTKMIIADEITGNSKAKIESLQAAYEDAGSRLRYTETIVKEKKIFITDTYESYVGKEFLTAERLEELRRILESGEAGNISEAIEVYKNRNMSRK